MSEEPLFPAYIRRDEEQEIRREALRVREDGQSRAVLLYGPGGVGKTQLVRHLAEESASDPRTTWIGPVDIDDSEYWLLSNLERLVASRLDPESRYFGPYIDYLSQLPGYTRPRVDHETVVGRLGRIKQIFLECYKKFIDDSGETVVIVLDTVEAIRPTYLFLTLTQWIKALPSTLFILSGRPLAGDREDPLQNELSDPYKSIPVTTMRLGEFTQAAALDYLENSGVESGISADEKAKIVRLTRGHPLWLAFAVAYLESRGMPEEAEASLESIERDVPYRGDLPPAGQSLHEAFKRRLVAPYQESDFWHEAVKRLAVVRESVDLETWQRLMDDLPGPDGVPGDQAWDMLMHTPWIRPRANRRYVTLHDAVAEELAQRIIPVHDPDGQWRRQLWRKAAASYHLLTDSREAELAELAARLDEQMAQLRTAGTRRDATAEDERSLIQEVTLADARARDLRQLQAVCLYYDILCDFAGGCREFLRLFDKAKQENDVLFQSLLAFEMQRFLPVGVHAYPLGDVLGEVIGQFRDWLSADGQQLFLEVGLSMADYLIRDEQPEAAFDLLDKLPAASADLRQHYRLSNQKGNACMRIPGRVKDGAQHFIQALEDARELKTPNQLKLIAAAHKELGFYYRNEGLWEEADAAYAQARDVISATLTGQVTDEDREELASIQTNWAYVKGLVGAYRDGTNLAESAVKVRRRLKKRQEEGISWSVCGEVYRYERRFHRAWSAYAEAEQIFEALRSWPWLGLIYQEQAICLFQAAGEGIVLTPGADPLARARELITLALDLCRDLSVRGQPSALNRAGRIFGQEDADAGLRYLADGIDLARRLSDGWFWFANLIEYVELCYRAWARTGRPEYRELIAGRAAGIDEVMAIYAFPDLKGRWNLLQGHLGLHDWLEAGGQDQPSEALERYKEGFAQLAQGYAGSSGAATIASEFETFGELVWRLPPELRAEWQQELRQAWAGLTRGSTLLLARLEELY